MEHWIPPQRRRWASHSGRQEGAFGALLDMTMSNSEFSADHAICAMDIAMSIGTWGGMAHAQVCGHKELTERGGTEAMRR